MTEEQWLASPSSAELLGYFMRMKPAPSVMRRKCRLFGCACCRLQWQDIPEGIYRQAVEIAERHADGMTKAREMQSIHRRCGMSAYSHGSGAIASDRLTGHNATTSLQYTLHELHRARGAPAPAADVVQRQQLVILRDIFGNPFRPVTFDPVWRSEAAVGIARGIYDDRAFERLPILADALQEAGCEHPDILSHCREPGVHVRGCWVVDLVLGKE